jgi:hypothetical protein
MEKVEILPWMFLTGIFGRGLFLTGIIPYKKLNIGMVSLPALAVLGRTEAEPQGSGAGGWFVPQGSLPFMGGTEGLVPHGSTGLATAP